MAKRHYRKIEAPNEALSAINMGTFLFKTFVGAPFRLIVAAFDRKPCEWRNVACDIMALALVGTVMYFVNFYRGIFYIGFYLGFVGIVAYLRHGLPESQYIASPPVEQYPNSPQPHASVQTTASPVEFGAVPKVDFAKPKMANVNGARVMEVDQEELDKWLSKNPDLSVEENNINTPA